MDSSELVRLAREVLPFAYAPFSGYRVGAALLCVDGRVFRGVNIENSSLGLSICAERGALAAAVAAGCRSFSLLAVVSEKKSKPYPCGACRQVLQEFSRDLLVIVAGETDDDADSFTLGELLPHAFRFKPEM